MTHVWVLSEYVGFPSGSNRPCKSALEELKEHTLKPQPHRAQAHQDTVGCLLATT